MNDWRGLIPLLAGASAIALAGAAHAQAADPAATAGRGAGTVGEVVVTGSRIERAGYSAPTPVTVLNTDDLAKKAPSNLPAALNQLPQFAGSISQNAQADTGASKVRSGNYLDIRALGPQRVLILEDGRRVPPTSSNGPPSATVQTKWPPRGPRSSISSPGATTSWKKGETSPSSRSSIASSMRSGSSGADAIE